MTLEDTTKKLFEEYGTFKALDSTYKQDPFNANVRNYAKGTFGPELLKLGEAAYRDSLEDHLKASLEERLEDMSKLDRKSVYAQIKEEVKPEEFKNEHSITYWQSICGALGADFSKEEALKEVANKYNLISAIHKSVGAIEEASNADEKKAALEGLYKTLKEQKGLSKSDMVVLTKGHEYDLVNATAHIALRIAQRTEEQLKDHYMKEVERDGKKEKVVDTEKYAKHAAAMESVVAKYVEGNDKDKDVLYKAYSIMTGAKKQLTEAIKKREEEAKKSKKA